jgi:hypothetical protein
MGKQSQPAKWAGEGGQASLRYEFRYPHGLWNYVMLLALTAFFAVIGVDLLADFSLGAGEAARPLPPLVTGLMLALLAAVIAVALVEFLWLAFGREVVEISAERVTVAHTIWGVGPRRAFRREEVGAIFLSQQAEGVLKRWLAVRDSGLLDFKRGRIGINLRPGADGRVRTFRFGGALPPRKAEKVVKAIWARYPHYAPQAGGRKA